MQPLRKIGEPPRQWGFATPHRNYTICAITFAQRLRNILFWARVWALPAIYTQNRSLVKFTRLPPRRKLRSIQNTPIYAIESKQKHAQLALFTEHLCIREQRARSYSARGAHLSDPSPRSSARQRV